MGMFSSIGRGLKKAAQAIGKGVSNLFKKGVDKAASTVSSHFSDVAGVQANPTLGGPKFTESPYFYSKKEWKRRKRRLKLTAQSRHNNRNK